jgi:hypothetical protein
LKLNTQIHSVTEELHAHVIGNVDRADHGGWVCYMRRR